MVAAHAANLLIVDDEEELLWSAAHRLRKERPKFATTTATNGVDALALLAGERFDVLVADLRMPGMSGLELVLAARARCPDLSVVVMTAYPANDALQRIRDTGSIEYIEKPFDFGEFIETIERALRRTEEVGFRGAISVQTLPDVVQLYALSNTTGALRVSCHVGSGVIWFDRGSIPHAEVDGGLQGAEALYEIIAWEGGSFTMQVGVLAPRRTITAAWIELLMEGCRRADESGARSPPSTGEPKHTGWTIAPPEPDVHEEPLPGLRQRIPNITANPQETEMPNYKECLAKLDSIDGFIGACLCDSESGMVLATEGGGTLNLEVAGAANSEVVRAKRKAAKSLNLKDDIEDILITLGKQYHLIRPLKAKPNVFLYLALDRSRANLGMSRITLADVERELAL